MPRNSVSSGRCFVRPQQRGEHPTGLAAIRLLLLTGFRRMEALALERRWFGPTEHCIRFPDTQGGAQLRVIGRAAMDCIEIEAQPSLANHPSSFPQTGERGVSSELSASSTAFALKQSSMT
jgi:hypothetical protein